MPSGKYHIVRYPRSRVATFDVGRLGGKKHHIAGFIEVDVTEMRARIKQAKSEHRKVSFTAWLLKVIAHTIRDIPEVHAINRRGRKQVVFDDVDISMPVEKLVDGTRVPLAMLIRAVDGKTVEEIHTEIQEAIHRPVESGKDYVLAERKGKAATNLFFFLPQWLRLMVWRMLMRDPFAVKKNMGTVIVTNISAAGRFSGWVLPKSLHNLAIGVGSVCVKPWVVGGKIEIRNILYLSILFDHDVIDGAPAARFVEKLVRNIEHPFEF